MTPDELRARLGKAGLERYADGLVGLARPSARLRSASASDNDLTTGASKLGGNPDLAPSFQWPDRDGRPLSFIAQIHLSDVTTTLPDEGLPTRGLLSFFYDAEEQPWGFRPSDRGSAAVTFTPPSARLDRREPPPALDEEWRFKPFALKPELETTFAPSESAHVEALGIGFNDAIDYGLLFDEDERQPDQMQADMQLECQLVTNGFDLGRGNRHSDPGALDWRLLLQIDTEDDAGMMWGDAGRIYYWIRAQDLAAGSWDAAWLILQC
jgi:uncharacterized protein YwqG